MENFVRFFNCPIPVTGCNLRCDYCYLVQQGNEKLLDFKESNEGFMYSVPHMLKALDPERLGGICAFHVCGEGETMLWSEICDFALGLYEMGHYVSFTTNCTITKTMKRFTEFPREYREKMFFKCSFHYREFKKRGLLETFAANVNALAGAGISYTVELVTNDYVLDNLEEIKKFSMENFGAMPHVLTQRSELVRGKYPRMESLLGRERYDKTWGQFDSALFKFHQAEFDKKHNEFCYAGVYSLQFHLKTGNVFPCPGNNKLVVNLFENIEQKPKFVPVGHNCPFDNCWFGYVTHILGGVNRELNSEIYFKEFRDRVRKDNGQYWLSDTMRFAYGHRCSEFHEPLSQEQELFFDCLMRVVYKGVWPDEPEMDKIAGVLSMNMEKAGVKNVAIYGMAAVGKWIRELCTRSKIDVLFGIDRKYDSIVSDINIISPEEKFLNVDCIIVTVYSQYESICKKIRPMTDARIVSVLELV